MTELDRVLERVRQNRAARVPPARASYTTPAELLTRVDGTFAAGARVFDLVSGQEGVIVARTRENVLVPTA